MRLFNIVPANLKLFEGGEGGAGTGADGAASQSEGAENVQAGTNIPGSSRRAKKTGALDNVVYGKAPEVQQEQEDSAAESETKPRTEEERRQDFKRLIDGEYKNEFTAEFQSVFDRRFKDAKQNEEQLKQLQPLIETLARKYKVDGMDLQKLVAAVEGDDSNFAAGAEEAGLDVPRYKNMLEMQKKAEAYDNMVRQNEARQRANAQMMAWEQEGEALKAEYPDFDFVAEVKNPQFISLLRSNVPVKVAYEAIHMADIKNNLATQTARQTEKRVTDSIRAKGARPTENGVSSQSGIIYRSDPSKYSKADRAEIARRAARGERIEF